LLSRVLWEISTHRLLILQTRNKHQLTSSLIFATLNLRRQAIRPDIKVKKWKRRIQNENS
jgi:hypothetical protein